MIFKEVDSQSHVLNLPLHNEVAPVKMYEFSPESDIKETPPCLMSLSADDLCSRCIPSSFLFYFQNFVSFFLAFAHTSLNEKQNLLLNWPLASSWNC